MPGLKTKTRTPIAAQNRIFVVDDHDIVRFGVGQLISREADLVFCGAAESVAEALPLIIAAQPDLVITDLPLKKSNGLDLVKELKNRIPKMSMLVMSTYDELIWGGVALRAGAAGYIMKKNSVNALIPAIRTILAGGIYVSQAVSDRILEGRFRNGYKRSAHLAAADRLSGRELQVLHLMGQLRPSREIAAELSLRPKAVEYHKQNIKEKLHFRSSLELRQFASQFHLVSFGGEL